MRAWVALDRPGKDGTTAREHAEQLARQCTLSPAGALARMGLSEPEIPPAGAFLWSWWRELASGRGGNASGPQPVSWAEMDAWARLTGTELSPWHAAILRHMDTVFLACVADKK